MNQRSQAPPLANMVTAARMILFGLIGLSIVITAANADASEHKTAVPQPPAKEASKETLSPDKQPLVRRVLRKIAHCGPFRFLGPHDAPEKNRHSVPNKDAEKMPWAAALSVGECEKEKVGKGSS